MATQDAGGVLARDALIGLKAYWRVVLTFYDSSNNLEYVCCHEKLDAPTSVGTWAVWKITTGASGVSQIEGPITGIADNRATLAWR